MGWSHGGVTVLTALHRLAVEVAGVPRSNFRAAVAWYPFCLGDAFTTPLLILIGDKDDWAPARSCVQLMKDLRTDSAPVTLKVYPGAYHSFDRLPSERITYKGHRLERHPQAAALAEAEVKRFFAQHLTAQPQTR